MPRNPFKQHRFPPKVILCTVGLSLDALCRDVRDLLAEGGIEVGALQSTVGCVSVVQR